MTLSTNRLSDVNNNNILHVGEPNQTWVYDYEFVSFNI